MAFTAQSVFTLAQRTLQDAGGVRWLLPELLDYLNAGTREIALQKPTATSETVNVQLVEGTKQTLPAGYHKLLSVIRNVTSGRAVTPVVREVLDMNIPGWHSTSVLPFTVDVMHVHDDMFDVTTFHVCPGNTGSGVIVAILSRLPAQIATPANPLDIAAYNATVPLAEIYRNCLVDYVCYRSFSKDMNIAGSAQRAQGHYQLFQQALGIKSQVEMAQNIDTPKSRFSQ
jgi:hypothetical protein